MNDTYTNLSGICSRFYDLVESPPEVAEFVYSKVKNFTPQKALFIGGFFSVARILQNLGISEVSVVDYTDEMVKEGQKRLPGMCVEKRDIRSLNYDGEFDCVFSVGRVFTHVLTQEDADNALKSIWEALKPGGVTFIDNYEDTKIQKTDYFNGRIAVGDKDTRIIRVSSTDLISSEPYVVNWKAQYEEERGGVSTRCEDEMPHRAFARGEMSSLLEKQGFKVLEQGDNFDDTSFFTTAMKV